MTVNFIRHGKTQGNIEKKYIGRTDEPLSDEGKKYILEKKDGYPECDFLVVSPMKRCMETASIIYPGKEQHEVDELRETDFGLFEGKNYQELSDNPLYQKWIDSNGTMDFPEGEAIDAFKKRCIEGFLQVVKENYQRITFIVHGGTIMSIMEHFEESQDYYKWQCGNGCGFICDFDGEKLRLIDTIG